MRGVGVWNGRKSNATAFAGRRIQVFASRPLSAELLFDRFADLAREGPDPTLQIRLVDAHGSVFGNCEVLSRARQYNRK
jgi:hypothetical protein